MNPITYCAAFSCSDKDWEVFGTIALITIVGVIVICGIVWLTGKIGKEKNMK